jgi:hypothetical protein
VNMPQSDEDLSTLQPAFAEYLDLSRGQEYLEKGHRSNHHSVVYCFGVVPVCVCVCVVVCVKTAKRRERCIKYSYINPGKFLLSTRKSSTSHVSCVPIAARMLYSVCVCVCVCVCLFMCVCVLCVCVCECVCVCVCVCV